MMSKTPAPTTVVMHPQVKEDYRLEKWLAARAVMMLARLVLSLRAVGRWIEHRFSPLAPGGLALCVIPHGLLLALGRQVALASFLPCILGLQLKQ